MLGQIYAQLGGLPDEVVAEYRRCNNPPFWSSPKTTTLMHWLKKVSQHATLFIFVDALDEHFSGHEIFELLLDLSKAHGNHRIIVTSRPNLEVDIADDIAISRLNMEDHVAEIDDDIRQYVLHRLSADNKLRRWSQDKYRDLITDGLLYKSNGM